MPPSLGEAVLYLLGDKTKLDATVSEAQKSTQKSLTSIGKGMQLTGTVMSAAVTAPLVAMGFASVNAASNLGESMNAIKVVFGEASESVDEFGKTAATTVGLSNRQFNELATTTGAFLQNVGFDAAGAADETVTLTKRAANMASVFNTDVADAMGAIQSGLKGEFNPLERFGVKLNAAAIEAKALSMGLGSTTVSMLEVEEANLNAEKAMEASAKATKKYGKDSLQAREAANKHAQSLAKLEEVMAGGTTTLDDNAKAAAALELIYKQTAITEGDFINTSTGLANSTRIAKAELENASAALGQQLLPYAVQAVGVVRELVGRFTAMSPEGQKMVLIIGLIAAAIGPLLVFIGTLITSISALIPVITAVSGALTFPLIAIILAVIAAVALLYFAWTNNWGGIRDKLTEFFNTVLVPTFNKIVEWLKVAIPAALEWLKNAWETVLWPAIKKVRDWIVDVLFPALQELWTWLSTNVPEALQKLSDFWNNVLLPAIMKVYNWWIDTMLPFLEAFADFLGSVLGLAITALTVLWETVLLPALEDVWDYLDKNVFPIFKDIAEFFSVGLTQAIEDLTKVWTETLLPGLKEVWKYLGENIWPIIEKIGLFVRDTFVGAIAGLTDAFSKLAGWLDKVNEKLKAFKPPAVIDPHSPTPFEMGIRGISKAMDELSNKSLAGLTGSLNDLGRFRDLQAVTDLEFAGASSTVTQNIDLTANFPAESPVSLIEKVKMIRMLGVG